VGPAGLVRGRAEQRPGRESAGPGPSASKPLINVLANLQTGNLPWLRSVMPRRNDGKGVLHPRNRLFVSAPRVVEAYLDIDKVLEHAPAAQATAG